MNNCPTGCNTKQSIYYSAHSLYMFRVSTTPIIRSTQNCNYSEAKLAWPWPRWREVAAQKIWPVPEAVVTVLRNPDDGCGWHPKHVEWTCRIMNRLLCIYLSNQPTWCKKFLFYNKFISCLYMFRAHVLIIRRSKLHYTASGIIPPICVMIPETV